LESPPEAGRSQQAAADKRRKANENIKELSVSFQGRVWEIVKKNNFFL